MATKVTIGVPTNRLVKPETAQSLFDLVTHGGYDFHIVVADKGYTIAENRTYIAVQALKNESDYLFFVDDDMQFNEDILDKLIAHDKDIVGGVYSSRMPNSPRKVYTTDGEVIDALETELGLTEVMAKGTALMLIKMEVFEMPRPWFEFKYDENGMCTEGEDWFFCKKARKHDFSVWVDPSIENYHIGDYEYKL